MSINIEELFRGVAVLIDDEINDPKANISKISEQISSENIPIIKYSDIPDLSVVVNFKNLSFVLLDWRLIKPDISAEDFSQGVTIPSILEDENISRNIAFIRNLLDNCYCPIFIFSNEEKSRISDILISNSIYSNDGHCNIFIESKASLQVQGSLQSAIEKWVKNNPTIYVLKEWEREYQKCKTQLFLDFQKMSHIWPQVMWKCFEKDGGNKSSDLGELISQNIHTRMKPFEFSEEILKMKDSAEKLNKELQKVLEGASFLKELREDDISPGDVFRNKSIDKEGHDVYTYQINIRAQCDTIRAGNMDHIMLYCIKGQVIDTSAICKEDTKVESGGRKIYRINNGQFTEQINNAIIPFIDDGKTVEFKFNDLCIKPWKDLKAKRIGRLLPPYITRIQQRYALYLQRQGLPRIPDEAFFSQEPIN